MKRIKIVLLVLILQMPLMAIHAREHEAQTLALNLQKLNQLIQILDKMYDGYKILSDGYNKIKQVTNGTFSLHDLFPGCSTESKPGHQEVLPRHRHRGLSAKNGQGV
ncbi:hypothetical protein MKQ70_32460 [Chitinophaga sedimenti]|uniref:hypothetical protein n=1 Tax=Chitinophaga sedimenti TaxID=2033606 RepID=UPI0020036F84|nr:hypothetical protein [Chitinophaga sedimenti]MCK7559430.1 hypothetical protein [Chitinophaga sedimenti]